MVRRSYQFACASSIFIMATFKVSQKNDVLLDFCFLQRITGKHIAENILEVLAKHNMNIVNCRRQYYDTTTSMSSSSVGVQH